MNQSAARLWETFKQKESLSHDNYDTWAFGNSSEMADELLQCVLSGEKTGTSSLHLLYDFENEELPEAGKYNVILDGNGNAQAILRTKMVEILPFSQISELHGYLEGEGDRTLAYWRSVHRPFFEQELTQYSLPFSEDLLVVYEFFELVFQKSN